MMPNVAVPCPDAGIPQYRVTPFPIALDDVAPSDDKAAMNSVDSTERNWDRIAPGRLATDERSED
jgi:hypothetical protein